MGCSLQHPTGQFTKATHIHVKMWLHPLQPLMETFIFHLQDTLHWTHKLDVLTTGEWYVAYYDNKRIIQTKWWNNKVWIKTQYSIEAAEPSTIGQELRKITSVELIYPMEVLEKCNTTFQDNATFIPLKLVHWMHTPKKFLRLPLGPIEHRVLSSSQLRVYMLETFSGRDDWLPVDSPHTWMA